MNDPTWHDVVAAYVQDIDKVREEVAKLRADIVSLRRELRSLNIAVKKSELEQGKTKW